MTGEHHDIALDFPEHRERIEHLHASNTEFSRLFDQYREVSTELLAIEAKVEMQEPSYVEALKKQRLDLKDKIHRFLSAV